MLTAPAFAGTSGVLAPSSQAFGYSGDYQYFTVPDGVHQVHLAAWGGGGGNGGERAGLYAAPGGLGAQINLDAAVNPGDELVIEVGQHGGNASGQSSGLGGDASGTGKTGGPGGTVNDTRDDGTAGGGGGGGTTVIDPSVSSTPLLIAGGGGGGGGGGELYGYNGGQGGDAGSSTNSVCDPTYGPGMYGNGFTGGAGGQCSNTQDPGGVGGSGEAILSGAGTGGGGGGGLYGGDGGASGGSSGGGAGGGGAGTSFWSSAAAKNVVVTNGGPGDGGVVVTWYATPPAGAQKTESFDGAPQTFTVPAGVTQLAIRGWGGSGGLGGGNFNGLVQPRGGFGAVVSELVAVSPGDRLIVAPGGAGGNGDFKDSSTYDFPINGGSGGASGSQGGGKGGSITVADGGNYYAGGTGGGGGAGTLVLDTSNGSTLLDAGGGGGGGGDSDIGAGYNGGPGGNAGSPLISGNDGDGGGYWGSGSSASGEANGVGGAYAAFWSGSGQSAGDSTAGNVRGTGGGGGGGQNGGLAGGQCTGLDCAGTGGGGGAGRSAWVSSAQDVTLGNTLGGAGGVTISWTALASQTITFTSSPPDHPVYGGSYTPSATGGPSGQPVVLSIDSSSTAGACSLDSGTVSFTGIGSCVIDANQAGNQDYDTAAQVQQTVNVDKAALTVTADDKNKQFGDPVPTLTATITGFVNHDTLATALSGNPDCTTTATATSAGGTYPITCAHGSLSAADYSFRFVDGTLTVAFAHTISGSYSGQLNVSPGAPVLIGPKTTISGPVTVQPGGALEIDGASITGPLKASGAAEIRVCNTSIHGPTVVTDHSGLATFGDGTSGCAGNQFTGPVRITNNIGGVIFDENTVTGPLTITGNSGTLTAPNHGSVEAIGNTPTGKTDIQQN